jgi:hypothetical protein
VRAFFIELKAGSQGANTRTQSLPSLVKYHSTKDLSTKTLMEPLDYPAEDYIGRCSDKVITDIEVWLNNEIRDAKDLHDANELKALKMLEDSNIEEEEQRAIDEETERKRKEKKAKEKEKAKKAIDTKMKAAAADLKKEKEAKAQMEQELTAANALHKKEFEELQLQAKKDRADGELALVLALSKQTADTEVKEAARKKKAKKRLRKMQAKVEAEIGVSVSSSDSSNQDESGSNSESESKSKRKRTSIEGRKLSKRFKTEMDENGDSSWQVREKVKMERDSDWNGAGMGRNWHQGRVPLMPVGKLGYPGRVSGKGPRGGQNGGPVAYDRGGQNGGAGSYDRGQRGGLHDRGGYYDRHDDRPEHVEDFRSSPGKQWYGGNNGGRWGGVAEHDVQDEWLDVQY